MSLISVADLEQKIIDSGLYPYLHWQLREFPPELHPYCGKGLGIWQYPNQFAKYMHFVSQNPINLYAEIGVAAGGTFMFSHEFLKPKKSYAVDIARPGQVSYIQGASPFDGCLEAFLNTNKDTAEFLHGDCDLLKKTVIDRNETIDLLLIDGDHSYEGVKKDFKTMRDHARIFVFHDIANDACPGVRKFWNELKTSGLYNTIEFVDQYDSVPGSYLGIGVLQIKG